MGSILYYTWAVDMMVLMSLSTITSKQSTPTTTTKNVSSQLFNYLSTHPNGTIRYFITKMVLNIHPDALYLSAKKKHAAKSAAISSLVPSRAKANQSKWTGYFCLCAILRFVVASTVEAELDILFHNCKEGGNSTHPPRIRPSITPHVHPLQECYDDRDCK